MTERRRAERRRKRMPCELWVGGRRYSGFVLDLSERGLFVQTAAAPQPLEPVAVRIRDEADPARGPIELQAVVARRYVVPQRLASVARGGVGLKVTDAPAAFAGLVARRGERPGTGASPAGGGAAPSARRFRVRLQQKGGTRSRTLDVEASSEAAAGEAARGELGPGWELVSARERPGGGGPAAR